jgi:hypothetical protein
MVMLAGIPAWVQNLGKKILNGLTLSPDEEQRLNAWRLEWKPERRESAWEHRDIPGKKQKILQHF